MRIDGTDASSTAYLSVSDTQTSAKDAKRNSQINPLDNKSISQMTNFEKNELPVSEKAVIDAIERANKAISGPNTRLQFSIHKDTKAIVVKMIDSDTNQVIREIPPEKILDMVAKMIEMAGLFVDERR